MTDPGKIVIAGDWHGNTRWACHVIEEAAKALEGEESKIILQLGDFLPTYMVPPAGIDDGKRRSWVTGYLLTLEQTLRRHEMQLYFIDGNHEDWSFLREADKEWCSGMPAELCRPHAVALGTGLPRCIYWLQRGHRWQWHGREWLAFGGAGSPNRVRLTEGWNWWCDEEIIIDQVASAASQGHADVLVSHDMPSRIRIHYEEPPRDWLQADLARCEEQRDKLQMLADSVTPEYIFHGHHHILYRKTAYMDHGPVGVMGLGTDGLRDNWAVLDVRSIELS